MRAYYLLLLLIPAQLVGQDSKELICYSRYSIVNDQLDSLVLSRLNEVRECLNDSVVLSFTVYISRYAYKDQIDTSVQFEIAPFFTWKNVGRNYRGLTNVEGVLVFIRENETGLWLQGLGTDTCVRQKVIGDFNADFWEDSDELPNSIYDCIRCIYRLENGVFVFQGRRACAFRDWCEL